MQGIFQNGESFANYFVLTGDEYLLLTISFIGQFRIDQRV